MGAVGLYLAVLARHSFIHHAYVGILPAAYDGLLAGKLEHLAHGTAREHNQIGMLPVDLGRPRRCLLNPGYVIPIYRHDLPDRILS